MPRFNFVGGTYQSQSILADCERSMNLYPEVVESGKGKNGVYLLGTPGLKLFSQLPTLPVRALLEINGQCFAITSAKLYELFSGGGFAERGSINAFDTVSVATNGAQLCIVTGGNGYIYDFATQTLSQIDTGGAGAGFLGAGQVVCIDGYFICNKPNSRTFFISNYMDGKTWDALKFANAEAGPSNIQGILAAHRILWCFGSDRAECFYDSGDVNFPFTRVDGAELDLGSSAAESMANAGNSVFWLGSDADGNNIVYMASGYAPTRISTHAVESAFSGYATTTDAIGYAYQQAGHTFYVLSFPAADKTWVYDVASGMWHERGYWDGDKYKAHLGRCHAYAFGKHLVGDYLSGNVYALSRTTYTDNGAAIRRMRIAPHVTNELNRMFYSAFTLDMETGVGLDGDPAQQGTDPVISLSWSDDGGRNYSQPLDVSFGKIGETRKRVEWRRLGYGRDRVFQVVTSEPVPIALIEAYLKLTPGR